MRGRRNKAHTHRLLLSLGLPAAITRAKELVVLIGSQDVLSTCVTNAGQDLRRSQLPLRLRAEAHARVDAHLPHQGVKLHAGCTAAACGTASLRLVQAACAVTCICTVSDLQLGEAARGGWGHHYDGPPAAGAVAQGSAGLQGGPCWRGACCGACAICRAPTSGQSGTCLFVLLLGLACCPCPALTMPHYVLVGSWGWVQGCRFLLTASQP